MALKSLPLSEVTHLLGAGPIVLVTTAQNGKNNVMTIAWHTPLDFKPPLVGCVIGKHFTTKALEETKQCVLAIPTVEMAEAVVGIGSCSGADTDKFAKFGLHAQTAETVAAPLIGECYVNLECKIVDTTLAEKYEFYVMEVTKAWIDPSNKNPKMLHHRGGGSFVADGETIEVERKKT
jgi:flavin reductase (DIM6/NTAB) family NADH-FMN oxidoreductase RutF